MEETNEILADNQHASDEIASIANEGNCFNDSFEKAYENYLLEKQDDNFASETIKDGQEEK
jgi:hypothetical protein